MIVSNSDKHAAFSECELIADVKEKKRNGRENAIVHERVKAVPFLGAMDGEQKAKELNMYHIYIRYLDFLWGFIFIGPNLYYLWMKGTLIMKFRIFMIKKGWMKMTPNDNFEGLIATFCFKQTQVILSSRCEWSLWINLPSTSIYFQELTERLFQFISQQAFFVGTVLHSLDHTLMEWNLPDPL